MQSAIHLTAGDFYADIVRDNRNRKLWMYVVQRKGSTEVLAMGTCAGAEECKTLARKILNDLAGSSAATTGS